MRDYAELRKLAEEATAGEWSAECGDGTREGGPKFPTGAKVMVYSESDCDLHPIADFSCNHTCRPDWDQEANAKYVAAASPKALIQILDTLKIATEALERIYGCDPRGGHPCFGIAIRALARIKETK